jgi:hypothetical protein
MKNKLNKLVKRRSQVPTKPEPIQPPARITNENLSEHREEVLGRARRFIYPLRHSKHRLVVISTGLLLLALVFFISFCVLSLYKFKSNSEFLYQVSRVIPFPVARIGSDFVAYENYLFEINHYTHYYSTQQNINFDSENGARQLSEFKKRALNKVINDSYVRELASQRGISVTDKEVNDAITVIRNQNRLGSSDKEFESVLRDFWDWSVDDFKRSLKQQLLNEKLIASLDTEAKGKAESALAQLKSGADFAKLAREVSEDTSTKAQGGDFGFEIDKSNRDVSPKTVEALFALQPNQFSEIINIGYGLEIVKNEGVKGDKIRGAHIVFNFKDLNSYLGEIKDQKPARTYVNF